MTDFMFNVPEFSSFYASKVGEKPIHFQSSIRKTLNLLNTVFPVPPVPPGTELIRAEATNSPDPVISFLAPHETHFS